MSANRSPFGDLPEDEARRRIPREPLSDVVLHEYRFWARSMGFFLWPLLLEIDRLKGAATANKVQET